MPTHNSALLLIGLGCITAGALFVALAWQRLSILQRWAPTRHLAASAIVAAGILRSPATLTKVIGLSSALHFLTAFNAWCAAHSVGA